MSTPVRPLLLAATCLLAWSASSQTPPHGDPAPTDYAALGAQIRTVLEAGYHSPPELASEPWTRFFADVEAGFAEAETDRDAVHAFDMAVASLGMSHLHLRRSRPSTTPARPRASGGESRRQHVRYDLRPDGVAVLRVDRFLLDETAPLIAEAMEGVADREPRALVVDLRQCSGGDVSSMLVAAHLLDEPTRIGLFIAAPWWAENDRVPTPGEWDALPQLTELDLGPFYQALTTVGAGVGVVAPAEPRYSGPVYVLTSPETASAAEPLVHLLKQTGRATVVGERTMGAMLSSDSVELSDGWTLVFPAADYFTAEGGRLEGVGVAPDAPARSNQALRVAVDLVTGAEPPPADARGAEVPEHEALMDRMVGDWVVTGTIAGERVTHDVRAEWILGRRYVRLHELARERDESGDPAYEAWIDVAWDPEAAEYVVLWLDNTETTNFEEEGVGHGTPVGDRIPFVWRLADGTGIRNTWAYDRARDAWSWTIENVGGSGGSAPFADLLLTRR